MALRRKMVAYLSRGTATKYVNQIEIYVKLRGLRPAQRTNFLCFVHALGANPSTRPRRVTVVIKKGILSSEKKEVSFFLFLQALRAIPGFQDVEFEVSGSFDEISEDVKEKATAMRDALQRRRKRSFEQYEQM